jgi:hypothetical protein
MTGLGWAGLLLGRRGSKKKKKRINRLGCWREIGPRREKTGLKNRRKGRC